MQSQLKILRTIHENSSITIYSAYDYILCEYVAIEIENIHRKNSILSKEYEILEKLQPIIPKIPKIFNFFQSFGEEKKECIEMELLGSNISSLIKKFKFYNKIFSYDVLIKSLKCIEIIHNNGFIHNKINAKNFCINKNDEEKLIEKYKKGEVINSFNIVLIDFKYIEYNNINKKKDLFSFFLMILELLNEGITYDEDKIINKFEKCLIAIKDKAEMLDLLNYIKKTDFQEINNYKYIYESLYRLRNKEIQNFYYKTEINSQIKNLRYNLLPNSKKDKINNDKKNINNDHWILKPNNTLKISVPSLYSTYNTTINNSIYNKYLKQENFYDSVLKFNNNKSKQNFYSKNDSYIINYNKMDSLKINSDIGNDKNLIDSLIGNKRCLPHKIKNKKNRSKDNIKNNKKKHIIFDIIKIRK